MPLRVSTAGAADMVKPAEEKTRKRAVAERMRRVRDRSGGPCCDRWSEEVGFDSGDNDAVEGDAICSG